MDVLQVLEGATYIAFIVGAVVAVYELRDIKKERRLEVRLRIEEMSNSRKSMRRLAKYGEARRRLPRDWRRTYRSQTY